MTSGAPEMVFTTALTLPSSITSTTLGWPSLSFFVVMLTGSPMADIIAAVPSVAYRRHPARSKSRTRDTASDLCWSAMLSSIPVPGLKLRLAAKRAFVRAFWKSRSTPITSPVDFISGPRCQSTPTSLAIENTGAFTPTKSCVGHKPPG